MTAIALKDRFILRKPLLSIDKLFALQNTLRNGGRNDLIDSMRDIFSNPLLQEAIYTASIDLHQELIKWLQNTKTYNDTDFKLANSLYKYFSRMCVRSTPYGLFSGCSTGTFGSLSMNRFYVNAENIRKCSRLDMNYISEIASHINQDHEIRPYLIYTPNTSMYKIGDNIRLVEYQLKDLKRSYSTSMIKKNPFVDLVVDGANGGASINELASLLDEYVDRSDALIFVNNLIDNQILVSDLEPMLTGDIFFNTLLEKLRKIPKAKHYVAFLSEIRYTLSSDDRSVKEYTNLHQQIIKQFSNTTGKDLIQTDLFFDDAQINVDLKIKNNISEQITQLLRVNNKVKNEDLENFKASFYSRYEAEEIPLAVALDSETGVGYGISSKRISNHMPLLNGLHLPGKKMNAPLEWTDRNKFLYRKIQDAKKRHAHLIHITDADIKAMIDKDIPDVNFPASMQVFGSLMVNGDKEMDESNFLFNLTSLGGNSSNNTMARFGLASSEIMAEIDSTCRHEESQTDKIIAEIVHLPQSRMGNILMRPATFKYEIPYLGQSSVTDEFQIPLNDLMVSVSGDRVILRSKKLNREILPSLTTAHSFSRGLPVYKFLCDLQIQNMNQPFGWISAFDQEEIYIPRIQYKNIILRKAQWNIKKNHFSNHNEIIDTINELKTEYNIPRFVLLSQGDNELLIDFESSNSITILMSYLQKSDITLVEFLQTPEYCVVKDNNGDKYCNEVIFSLLTQNALLKSSVNTKEIKTSSTRKYSVGSEWLYLKIYTGTKTADKILSTIIRPICEELIEQKIIDKWFFIRFSDPEEHLRIRFHGNDIHFWSHVLARINNELQLFVMNGEVQKIQTDTYNQEIERYGVETMEMSESLFYNDSSAIVNFLSLIHGNEGEKYRWLFVLRAIDMLLSDFSLNLNDKADIISTMSLSYFKEFNGDDELKHSLNHKYRENRQAIENILNPDKDVKYLENAIDCFKKRSEMNMNLLENRELSSNQKKNLLLSYIHMTSIRMFIAEPRMQELVIYHYLSKHYESQLARIRRNNNELAYI